MKITLVEVIAAVSVVALVAAVFNRHFGSDGAVEAEVTPEVTPEAEVV